MANNNKTSFAYKLAAILLTAVIAISMVMVSVIFFSTRSLFFNTIASVELFAEINDCTLFINEDILKLVAGIDDENDEASFEQIAEKYTAEIDQYFKTINGNMIGYEQVPGH